MARCSSNGANVRCCEEYAVALTTWPRVRLRVPSIKATSSIAPIASPRRNKSRGGDDVHAVALVSTPAQSDRLERCTITSAPASFATPR